MSLQVTFKNFDHTEALDENIQERTDKIRRLFHHDVNVHWVCWVEHDQHYAEVSVTGLRGPKIQAKADSDNLYKTFDQVVKKIEVQVKRKIEKKQDRQVDHIWT